MPRSIFSLDTEDDRKEVNRNKVSSASLLLLLGKRRLVTMIHDSDEQFLAV
jgi:hypothetical protein